MLELGGRAVEEHTELVAAQPVGGTRLVERRRQPRAEPGEERVAGGVAVRVVVGLESIEVEHGERRRRMVGALADRPLEIAQQAAPVPEAGQVVGERQETALLDARPHRSQPDPQPGGGGDDDARLGRRGAQRHDAEQSGDGRSDGQEDQERAPRPAAHGPRNEFTLLLSAEHALAACIRIRRGETVVRTLNTFSGLRLPAVRSAAGTEEWRLRTHQRPHCVRRARDGRASPCAIGGLLDDCSSWGGARPCPNDRSGLGRNGRHRRARIRRPSDGALSPRGGGGRRRRGHLVRTPAQHPAWDRRPHRIGSRAPGPRDRRPGPVPLTRSADAIATANAVIVCVPTPIDDHHVPDLRALSAAARTVCRHARRGQAIILTSTAYVGSTRELIAAPLRARGLEVGRDICVAFSPERIDPANAAYPQELVPRVIGAVSERCAERAEAVIGLVAPATTRVSSPEAAEMTKLYENVFRAVNISLANELADACRELSLSPREVIGAAATKPFGFMPFRPGPGVGGHCIPCDPHYLMWQLKAAPGAHAPGRAGDDRDRPAAVPGRRAGRGRDLAGQQPRAGRARGFSSSGSSYKPGVSDVRESPALVHRRPSPPRSRGLLLRPAGAGRRDAERPPISVAGPPDAADYDLVIAHTVHPGFDHGFLADAWPLLDCTYSLEGRRIEL